MDSLPKMRPGHRAAYRFLYLVLIFLYKPFCPFFSASPTLSRGRPSGEVFFLFIGQVSTCPYSILLFCPFPSFLCVLKGPACRLSTGCLLSFYSVFSVFQSFYTNFGGDDLVGSVVIAKSLNFFTSSVNFFILKPI